MFGSCEIGIGVLKAINMNYTPQELQTDAIILVTVLILETIRVYLGRKSSLSEHGKILFNIFLYINEVAYVVKIRGDKTFLRDKRQ